MFTPKTVFITSGFTMVPNKVLLDPTLSAKAIRLLAVLEHHSGEHRVCWPGYAKLAEEVGCSVRWLPVIIDEVVQAGLLHVWYREGKTNYYTLLLRVDRQPKPTHAVASPQPTNPVRYEQKQAPITNNNRSVRRFNQSQEAKKKPIDFTKWEEGGENFKFTRPIGS